MNDQQLIVDVGAWAEKNFDYFNPWLGMVEETGEIAHCLLKHKQGIRGFDSEDMFLSEYTDALADVAIYAAHYAFLHPEVRPGFQLDPDTLKDAGTNLIIGLLLIHLADLEVGPDDDQDSDDIELLRTVLSCTATLAHQKGVDLREITYAVWDKVVSKRDWVESPCRGVTITPVEMKDTLAAPFRHLDPL